MGRKYRILYSLSEFMHGSMVRQVCDLVNGLNRDLFDVEICAEEIADEGASYVKALNVPYYQSPLYPPRNFGAKRWFRFLKSPLFLKRKRYDIIHSLHYSSIFAEPLVCRLAGHTKYIYVKSNLQWDNHRINWYLKSLLSDKIIAQSGSGRDILAEKGFSKKTVLIYNWVDCQEFRVPSSEAKKEAKEQFGIERDRVVFGYAAHFIEVKDHITLLKAFEKVRDRFPNATLILCGGPHDEEYYKRVVEYIRKNDLSDNVRMLGTLSGMKTFYAACDGLVFSSKFENFSLVILEAMSSGLPVIASNYGGNTEQVVDGKNGYLVEPQNHIQFAEKMQVYLKNPETLKIHGAASREIALTKFSSEAMIRKIEDLYLVLLS